MVGGGLFLGSMSAYLGEEGRGGGVRRGLSVIGMSLGVGVVSSPIVLSFNTDGKKKVTNLLSMYFYDLRTKNLSFGTQARYVFFYLDTHYYLS